MLYFLRSNSHVPVCDYSNLAAVCWILKLVGRAKIGNV